MKIKAVTVLCLMLTLTRYVDGGKRKCRAIPFDTYFLEGETSLPQNLPELSEIVYVPKRDALYFRHAAFNDNYYNDTKISRLHYSAESLAIPINISGALTFAYNNLNDIIYVGTNEGLYAVDLNHRILDILIKESVISVFIQNNIIYYVNGYNEVIVYNLNGNSHKIDLLDIAKLTRLVVNSKLDMVGITKKQDVMTLSHENGMIFHKSDKFGLPINLSVDNDIVYIYTTKGVYKMNSKGELDFVSNLRKLQALAFVNYSKFQRVTQTVVTAQEGTITIRGRYSEDPCRV